MGAFSFWFLFACLSVISCGGFGHVVCLWMPHTGVRRGDEKEALLSGKHLE